MTKPGIESWQQRVIDEHRELGQKRGRLGDFIDGSVFAGVFAQLPKDEQERLRRQHAAMLQYEQILAERIAHFRYHGVLA